MIGGRLAIGGRVAFEQEPPLGPRGAEELVKKAGLPHPGFPHDGHELPVACTGQRVRLAQRLDLRLAPHEARERPRGEGLEAWSAGTRPHQLKDLQRLSQPPDRCRAERFDLDHLLGEPEGLRRQEDAPRRGQLFHTGRQMRGLPDGRVIHMQIVADRPDHHFP